MPGVLDSGVGVGSCGAGVGDCGVGAGVGLALRTRRPGQRLAGYAVTVPVQPVTVRLRAACRLVERLRLCPRSEVGAVTVRPAGIGAGRARLRRGRRRLRRRRRRGARTPDRRPGQRLAGYAVTVPVQPVTVRLRAACRLVERLRLCPRSEVGAVTVRPRGIGAGRARLRRGRRLLWRGRRRLRRRRRRGARTPDRRPGQRLAGYAVAVPVQPVTVRARSPRRLVERLRLCPRSEVGAVTVRTRGIVFGAGRT